MWHNYFGRVGLRYAVRLLAVILRNGRNGGCLGAAQIRRGAGALQRATVAADMPQRGTLICCGGGDNIQIVIATHRLRSNTNILRIETIETVISDIAWITIIVTIQTITGGTMYSLCGEYGAYGGASRTW